MPNLLDGIFFLYFFTHIPITIFIDSQVVFSNTNPIYPKLLRDIVKNYSVSFKDSMIVNPPYWYLSFCVCELILQFPFFFVATYAFWKGNCRWIRVPALVYSAHVSTTVLPIITHILFHDFTTDPNPNGPITLQERLTLTAIYSPYLIVPLLLLLTMLFSSRYTASPSSGAGSGTSGQTKKQKQK